MNIVKLLEELACNTHYHIAVDELIQKQPDEIRQAFKNTSQLKRALCSTDEVIADRSGIVQVTNNYK